MKTKKQKAQKVWHKKTLRFEDYKSCLETSQIESKINQLEINKINADSLKEDQKKFLKNNQLTLKIQQRFRSEKHSAFTEEINNIALIWW